MTTQDMPRPASRGAKARAALGAMALLVIGAVIGVTVDRGLHGGSSPHGPAAALHEAAMSGMVEGIVLTPEQRRQVEAILRSRHNAMQPLWDSIHGHLATTLDSVHAEIEAVLTPDQRDAFRRWLRANGGMEVTVGRQTNPPGR